MSDKNQPKNDPPKKPLFRGPDPAEAFLGGQNFRGEVMGCPTGFSRLREPPEDDETEQRSEGEETGGREEK